MVKVVASSLDDQPAEITHRFPAKGAVDSDDDSVNCSGLRNQQSGKAAAPDQVEGFAVQPEVPRTGAFNTPIAWR